MSNKSNKQTEGKRRVCCDYDCNIEMQKTQDLSVGTSGGFANTGLWIRYLLPSATRDTHFVVKYVCVNSCKIQ